MIAPSSAPKNRKTIIISGSEASLASAAENMLNKASSTNENQRFILNCGKYMLSNYYAGAVQQKYRSDNNAMKRFVPFPFVPFFGHRQASWDTTTK